MNAVLPDWYPVAPLIKNGDEIFAYRGKKLWQYKYYTYYALLAFWKSERPEKKKLSVRYFYVIFFFLI